jgi:hypothetical protein
MQKQNHRCLLVACFAIKYIYTIDGDSLNSSGWDDVGHLKLLQAIQNLASPLYRGISVRLGKQLAVNFMMALVSIR